MPTQVQMKNVYLDVYGQASLTCPTCGRTKRANLSSYKDQHIPLKIKCSCGVVFHAIVETRAYYRKEAQLPGKFVKLLDDVAGTMTVENVSATGICFRTRLVFDLQKGDLLEVRFTLDKGRHAEVCRKVVVKYTNAHYVGVEFVDTRDIDTNLGHYLLPD